MLPLGAKFGEIWGFRPSLILGDTFKKSQNYNLILLLAYHTVVSKEDLLRGVLRTIIKKTFFY